jgi:hypothetical protein
MHANTINICLGHKPFPSAHSTFFDYHLSPVEIPGVERLIVVPDSTFGPHGSCLSEYAQLLWLANNSRLMDGFDFVRVIQYRRFVSGRNTGSTLNNMTWAIGVKESELPAHATDFSRLSQSELLNTVVNLPLIGLGANVYTQYASAHVPEDILNFSQFLLNREILEENEVGLFLGDYLFIPACNTGLFKKSEFMKVSEQLLRAAEFVASKDFVLRTDYQRRSVGFLLERLNSFLILNAIRAGRREPSFGFNKLITESPLATITSNI